MLVKLLFAFFESLHDVDEHFVLHAPGVCSDRDSLAIRISVGSKTPFTRGL